MTCFQDQHSGPSRPCHYMDYELSPIDECLCHCDSVLSRCGGSARHCSRPNQPASPCPYDNFVQTFNERRERYISEKLIYKLDYILALSVKDPSALNPTVTLRLPPPSPPVYYDYPRSLTDTPMTDDDTSSRSGREHSLTSASTISLDEPQIVTPVAKQRSPQQTRRAPTGITKRQTTPVRRTRTQILHGPHAMRTRSNRPHGGNEKMLFCALDLTGKRAISMKYAG